MLNPTSLLADALGRNLAETYRRNYGGQEPHIAAALDEGAQLVIERIASSDALYHDCQHTALVTLCVQDILHGCRLERMITPSDWLHTIFAALNHDIGYVRGICAGDTAEHFVIDAAGNTVTPPRGASDAFLMPYHVERGKIFVRERFAPVPYVDEERIANAIELTRFPVPDDDDHAATDTEASSGPRISSASWAIRSTHASSTRFITNSPKPALTGGSATTVPPIWSTTIRNSIGARSSAISGTRCVSSR